MEASAAMYAVGMPTLDLALEETNARPEACAALSATSGIALQRAWMNLDIHDKIVTSPTVLGHESSRRLRALLDQPGTALAVPPLPSSD